MALDYQRERRYAANLGNGADELETGRRKLDSVLLNLSQSYKCDEYTYISHAIDALSNRMRKLYNQLDDIESDIRDVSYEIYREDKRKEELRRQQLLKK